MRATFRNLFHTLNVAAFVRTRHGHAISVLRWGLILVPMALAVGSLCAAFLCCLPVLPLRCSRLAAAQSVSASLGASMPEATASRAASSMFCRRSAAATARSESATPFPGASSSISSSASRRRASACPAWSA